MTSFSLLQRRISRRRNPNPPSIPCPLLLMGKSKPPKKPSPISISSSKLRVLPHASPPRDSVAPSMNSPPPSSPRSQVEILDSVSNSPSSQCSPIVQSIVSPTVLVINSDLSEAPVSLTSASDPSAAPVKVVPTTEPVATVTTANPNLGANHKPETSVIASNVAKSVPARSTTQPGSDSWVSMVKGSSRQLKKKGEAFKLDSGEVCVKIPNSVIERNKKSWDCFVMGQFYYDPPSQGTIHNIVNGIWSKQYRDIVVSKMEGNSFLFRIPNAFTRSRVLNQRLWQIEGQTMFVAKWEPGLVPVKPELTAAPIWLELRNVPFQFFHEEGLERIAGLVGDPKFLHPSTANKTNLEVAKVFTLIDPRKPLPEAVNVQFDSGEIRRILVSSPFMPPVCSHCKQIGHGLRHCKLAPPTCTECLSTVHPTELCHKLQVPGPKKKNHRRRRSKTPVSVKEATGEPVKSKEAVGKVWAVKESFDSKVAPVRSLVVQTDGILLGSSVQLEGDSSGNTAVHFDGPLISTSNREVSESTDSDCEVKEDSSDVLSSDLEEEAFTKVLSKKQRRILRGKSLKPSA